MSGAAARRWAEQLAAWAIPPDILDAAPESPWGFPPGLWGDRAREAIGRDTPSRRRALEALPAGGTVLDVGCGGGAASLPLVPPARHLTGVDEDPGMLGAFADLAEDVGAGHREVTGTWPEVAPRVEVADLVVCHHVLYNVGDLARFVTELTAHTRGRVVVEITDTHPLRWTAPLWRELHGLDRPDGPTADDALAVVRELGLDVDAERWEQEAGAGHLAADHLVAFARRRLCLPADRDDDVRAALAAHRPPAARSVVTAWWDLPGTG